MSKIAKIYLEGLTDTFSIMNNDISVYGTTNTDTVRVVKWSTTTDEVTTTYSNHNLEIDQNIETIKFDENISNLKFAQTGNLLNVYETDGTTLITTIAIGDSATKVSFNQSSSLVDVAIVDGVMSIDGESITSTPTAMSKYIGLEKTTDEDGLLVYTKVENSTTTKYFVDDSSGEEVLVKYEVAKKTEVENTSNPETIIEISISSNTYDANDTKIAEGNISKIEKTDGTLVSLQTFERVFVFDTDGNIIGKNEHHETVDENGIRVSDVKYDADGNSTRDTSVTSTTYTKNSITYTKVVTLDDTTFNSDNRPTTRATTEEISHIVNDTKTIDSTTIYTDTMVYSGTNARVTTRIYDDGIKEEYSYDDNGVELYKKEFTLDSDGNIVDYTKTVKSTDDYDNPVIEVTKYDTSDNILSTSKTTTEVIDANYTNTIIDARINNSDGTYEVSRTSFDITSTDFYDTDDNATAHTIQIGTALTKSFNADWNLTGINVDVSQLGDAQSVSDGDVTYNVYSEVNGNEGNTDKFYFDSDNNLVKYSEQIAGMGNHTDENTGIKYISTNLRTSDADGVNLKDIDTTQQIDANNILIYEKIRTTIYNSDDSQNQTDKILENGEIRFYGNSIDDILAVLNGSTTDVDTVSMISATTLEKFNTLDSLATGTIYAEIEATNNADIFNINGSNILTIGTNTVYTNGTDSLDFTAYTSSVGTLAKSAITDADANNITLDTDNTTVYVIDSDSIDLDDASATDDVISDFKTMSDVATFLNAGFTTNNEANETHFFVINDGSESTNAFIYKFTDSGDNTDVDATELKLIGSMTTDDSATTVDDITIA